MKQNLRKLKLVTPIKSVFASEILDGKTSFPKVVWGDLRLPKSKSSLWDTEHQCYGPKCAIASAFLKSLQHPSKSRKFLQNHSNSSGKRSKTRDMIRKSSRALPNTRRVRERPNHYFCSWKKGLWIDYIFSSKLK